MKTCNLRATFAFCLAILVCMPAAGSPCGQSGPASRVEPAVSAKDDASPGLPATARDGLCAPRAFTSGAQCGRSGTFLIGEWLTVRPLGSGSLARSIAAQIDRLNKPTPPARRPMGLVQQTSSRHRNWVQRHPVLFGTLVGFGTGFLIGYLPGDDAVFEDFTAEFNGLVLGGIGAGAGALAGWVVSR